MNTQNRSSSGLLWVSVVSVLVGVLLAVVSMGMFSGKLEARVQTLERESTRAVTQAEWTLFEKDIRGRLDRIENKLDQHMTNGGK